MEESASNDAKARCQELQAFTAQYITTFTASTNATISFLNEWRERLEVREREVNEQLEKKEAEFVAAQEKRRKELDEKWTQFEEEKEKWERNTILLKKQDTGERVVVDVGGQRFTTTQGTLTAVPDSLLEVWFSRRDELKAEADDSYFIDRDGTHFNYILNYLRTLSVEQTELPDNPKARRELCKEAEFYKLTDLMLHLRSTEVKRSVSLSHASLARHDAGSAPRLAGISESVRASSPSLADELQEATPALPKIEVAATSTNGILTKGESTDELQREHSNILANLAVPAEAVQVVQNPLRPRAQTTIEDHKIEALRKSADTSPNSPTFRRATMGASRETMYYSLSAKLECSLAVQGASTSKGQPEHVTVDNNGRIVVTDPPSYRILIFSAIGQQQLAFGAHGTKKGQFTGTPNGVAVNDKNQIIAIEKNGRVHWFNHKGSYVNTVTLKEATLSAVATREGSTNIFLADDERSLIREITKSGKHVRNITFNTTGGPKFVPSSLAIDKRSRLFAADDGAVQVFDLKDGSHVYTLRANFRKVCAVATDAQNRLVVVDSGRHCISIFSPEFKLLLSFGVQGGLPGFFEKPHGVVVDKKGRLVVVDSGNQRVQIYTISDS
eukprot:Colp12_sorted_trinity150504_noHs@9621